MPRPLSHPELRRALHGLLARGPATATEACKALGVSQPTFSRLARGDTEILRIGRGRATRYGLRRAAAGLRQPLVVRRVLLDGSIEVLGGIELLEPDLFLFNSHSPVVLTDLPWVLHDLRPRGYLGRQLPGRHPELGLPPDVRLWGAEHVLRYLSAVGWNAPGDLLVGEDAAALFLRHAERPVDAVPAGDREARYPERAGDALRSGPAGSSAAGEQAKFLATRMDQDGGPVPVLVKFSPPANGAVAQRIADLLVCEHLALETLRAAGHAAAVSCIVRSAGRTFLEVERFDRVGWPGRRGVVSLEALDAQFTGLVADWQTTTAALVDAGIVPAFVRPEVALRQAFGALIGNGDMHAGNLSFFVEAERVTGLAPTYDMLPMTFAPRGHELVPSPFQPPPVQPTAVWRQAHGLARAFWAAAAAEDRLSAAFRELATEVLTALDAQLPAVRLLPGR